MRPPSHSPIPVPGGWVGAWRFALEEGVSEPSPDPRSQDPTLNIRANPTHPPPRSPQSSALDDNPHLSPSPSPLTLALALALALTLTLTLTIDERVEEAERRLALLQPEVIEKREDARSGGRRARGAIHRLGEEIGDDDV